MTRDRERWRGDRHIIIIFLVSAATVDAESHQFQINKSMIALQQIIDTHIVRCALRASVSATEALQAYEEMWRQKANKSQSKYVINRCPDAIVALVVATEHRQNI